MKIILLSLFFLTTLYAQSSKVCFYTLGNNIDDFKSLKIYFDKYLQKFGDYKFQAFSDKASFENYLKNNNDNTISIVSSSHYKDLFLQYKLKAKLIAKKNNRIKEIKVLIGKKGKTIQGIVSSAHTKKYTKKLLTSLKENKELSTLIVPKDIDALMSVGFGMSDFALVSKDSFTYLQEINGFLTKDLKIYKELDSRYRMLIASKMKDKEIKNIFQNMSKDTNGKNILNIFGVDGFTFLHLQDLNNLRGVE